MKRIFALIGVVLLVAMYLATFIFAMMDSPASDTWFKASIFATLIIPILLYGYQLMYKHYQNKNNPQAPPPLGETAGEDDTLK